MPKLAWYQILIVVIAGAALAVLVVNFIVTGRDIPGGLLSLLGTIFAAMFATDTALKWKQQNSASSSSTTAPESSSETEVKP